VGAGRCSTDAMIVLRSAVLLTLFLILSVTAFMLLDLYT
jgi:hypothetical protein